MALLRAVGAVFTTTYASSGFHWKIAFDGELSTVPDELFNHTYLHRPYRSDHRDVFRGTGDPSVLPLIAALLPRENNISRDHCIFLSEALVDRPDWFVFHRSDIVAMRNCLAHLVKRVGDDPSSPISRFISASTDALYDPTIDSILASVKRSYTFPKDPSLLFRGYLTKLIEERGHSGGLVHRMSSVLHGSSIDESSLDYHERWYYEKLVASKFSPHVSIHYSEFLESVMGRLMPQSRENQALWLFKLLVDNIPEYDRLDFDLSTKDRLSVDQTQHIINRSFFHKTNKVSSFYDFPGNFLLQIWTSNVFDPVSIAAIDSCMPVDFVRNPIQREDWDSMVSNIRNLYESLVQQPNGLLRMYTCLIDLVIEEKFSLPKDPNDFQRATVSVLYMMMLVHSSDVLTS